MPDVIDDRKNDLATWLIQRGLDGTSQQELLEAYSLKLVEMDVPLCRLHVAQRAFHPEYGGLGLDWWRDGTVSSEAYERSDVPSEQWLQSPLYHLVQIGLGEMRERLETPGEQSRFPFLNDLRERGVTDYFATGLPFEKLDETKELNPVDMPEGMLVSWSSDAKGGFSDADIDLIRTSVPHLGLALKSASNRQMAQDLLRVYLGRDAGNRVLSGDIRRGSVQQIEAAICYFDLTGFTKLAEQVQGEQLIEMLNDYFGVAVATIQEHGGSILKFMGDGMLAMFDKGGKAVSAATALDSAAALRRRLNSKNQVRKQDGLAATGFTLALHAGEISYGNIGAKNRLDFTVIGPAVNLTARLSGMHRSVGQDIIISRQLRDIAGETDHDLVSLGRYMLRDVSGPQELFTIYDPD